MREWFVVSALVVAGCGSPDTRVEPARDAEQLVFKMVTKERTFDGCIAGGEGCTYVRLDYPVLVDAPEGYAVTPSPTLSSPR